MKDREPEGTNPKLRRWKLHELHKNAIIPTLYPVNMWSEIFECSAAVPKVLVKEGNSTFVGSAALVS